MKAKATIVFLMLMLCSVAGMAEGIFSSTYGERWVTIEGVGLTGRYAYADGTTLRHGAPSSTSNPGDAYLWCLVQSGTNVRIYNKSLGQSYQLSQSSAASNSITLGTGNTGTFAVTETTYSTYTGYTIQPTGYSVYWNLYGGSDWASTYSAAPIGYWTGVDQHSLWTITEYTEPEETGGSLPTYTVSTNYDTYSTYALANAYDGDNSTYFWSNGAQTAGKYILFSFAEPFTLTYFQSYSTNSTDYPHSCNELQVSTNGTDWTTIGTFSDQSVSTFTGLNVVCQYVRIYATSTIANWLVVNEISFSGGIPGVTPTVPSIESIDKTGYSLVFSTETQAELSNRLSGLTATELAAGTRSFSDISTLERYWELCPRKTPVWRSRMGETEAERRQNMVFDNGTLDLHARTVVSASTGESKFITSGIQSWSNWQYGIFEIKAKVLGAHTGNFPALWMMPSGMRNGVIADGEQDWPYCGEIDIMEMIDASYAAYSTVHNGAKDKGLSYTYTNNGNKTLDNGYHTYTLVWKEDILAWFIDGERVFEYKKDLTLAGTDLNDQFPFNKPYFIIVNQSGGGNWAAAPDTTYDYEMDIEYVRVYQDPNEEGTVMNDNSLPATETYTRTGVEEGSWQSLCLPMNVSKTELSGWFDRIVVPQGGTMSGQLSAVSGQLSAVRRAGGNTEGYGEENGYWGERPSGSFAYSAEGSKRYHVYLTDRTAESDLTIKQGTPFFARLKSDAPLQDGTLTLTGTLSGTETAQTANTELAYPIYTDNTLETKSAEKLYAVGLLGDYAGSLSNFYGITASGSFVATDADDLLSNRAYLALPAGAEIFANMQTAAELDALEQLDVLDLTDASPEISAGTYEAGHVTYVRTVNNYYANFYLPFPIELSSMTGYFTNVYTPADFALYDTRTGELTLFLKERTTDETIPAFTPLLAKMTTDGEQKRQQDVLFASAAATTLNQLSNKALQTVNVYDYAGTQNVTTNQNYQMATGGTLVQTVYNQADGAMSYNGKDASFGNVSSIKAYRAVVQLHTSASAQAPTRIKSALGMEDTATLLEIVEAMERCGYNTVYTIDGRKIGSADQLQLLPQGIYIINGKKQLVK